MARIAITSIAVALLGWTAVQATDNDHSAPSAQQNITQTMSVIERDEQGNTPLMVAAAYGQTEKVRQLIAAGAWVNARGRIGNTALIYAAQEGHTEIVRLLVAAGADVEAANDFGSTARKLARGYGHRQMVELIDAAPAGGPGLLAGGL